jgi:DNA-binding HxlR family transcriptional regulator
MERNELEACPKLGAAFTLLGKRWNALILDLLAVRPARFSELDQAIPQISDRMLGERLRELVAAGLLEHSHPVDGPATYRLTEAGQALQPALETIRSWWARLEDSGQAVDRPDQQPSSARRL